MNRLLRSLFVPHDAQSRFLAVADFLRVICVFLVAWYHIWQQSWLRPAFSLGPVRLNFEPVVRTGYMMVDLLLMLSGFLLFLPWARSRFENTPVPSLGEYYRKRAARILPSYLFCIFAVLFFFALPGGEYSSAEHMWCDLLSHLTFTHNLFPMAYQSTRLNGVLWTLAVEVQFYLVAPFVSRAFRKKPLITYGVMVLAAFAYRFFYVLPMDSYSLHLNRLPAMLDAYANGMLGALMYAAACRYLKKSSLKAALMTALSALCLICIWRIMAAQSRVSGGYSDIHVGQMLRRFPLTLAGSLFLVSGGLGLSWYARLLSSRPVRWLSMISYNVYIWHAYAALKLKAWRIPPYAADLPNQAGEQPWQTQYTLISLAAAVLIGALATYLIEKPGARLLSGRKKG